MQLEDLVFKNSQPNFNDLRKYGFKRQNHIYFYKQTLSNSQFSAQIKINDKGKVTGKVIDQ